MKFLKTLLLLAVAVMACIGARTDDSLKAVTKTLEAKYKAMDAAYRNEDIATIEKMFDDQCKFKMKGEGQSLNKALFISGTKTLFKMRTVKSETKLISVANAKDGAYLATSHWSGETTEADKVKSTKGTDQTLYDTWKKTKNGWLITDRLIEQS
jgi:ketosteroid isomerase-like protein